MTNVWYNYWNDLNIWTQRKKLYNISELLNIPGALSSQWPQTKNTRIE